MRKARRRRTGRKVLRPVPVRLASDEDELDALNAGAGAGAEKADE